MALIRYPGSKAKLANAIYSRFPDEMVHSLWIHQAEWEYREPFFGAGAVGFKVLENLSPNCKVWLNDVDGDMCALWQTVKDPSRADALIRGIENFTPTVDKFYEFKRLDGKDDSPIAIRAFRKLALHRMSYSGLGYMSGGPLGGRSQSGKYNVECRWNPSRLKLEIIQLGRLLNKFKDLKITSLDFADVIVGAKESCFMYLDPPYYEKGPELYKHSMSDEDHKRLASLLRYSDATWVLSYDDHEVIRGHYDWAEIEPIEIRYTTAFSKGSRPKNKEVLISPSMHPMSREVAAVR